MAGEDRIKYLADAVRYHRELYYNHAAPEISDAEFDALWDELKSLDKFKASFTMDSAESLGGGEYKLTASGQAGPYGRVFTNFHFTNKLNNQNGVGEFTGMAWSQVDGVITEASLQGTSKFNGKTFTVYSFDALTDGKVMMWKGEFDFVNKFKFKTTAWGGHR